MWGESGSGRTASGTPLRRPVQTRSLCGISGFARSAVEAKPCQRLQIRPGSRVVTSWTSHALPSGSLKAQNDA
jgi:hypothetical protein